jgi:hypothetical protein
MPLFLLKGRRSLPATSPEPAAAPGLHAGAPPPDAGERIGQRLREIAAGVVAPEDAFEPALRSILEASGAAAGAVCLFDQRHEMLRLAAEVGLSDEGCRRLRGVRRGDPVGWDMPLHGLLNRRVYLIDSASKNRYVPPLVDAVGSVRTVACVPLYAGATPLGSLILIAVAPRVLGERDIRMLERPLREVTKMIEAIRRRGPSLATAPGPLAPVVADIPPSAVRGEGLVDHPQAAAARGADGPEEAPSAPLAGATERERQELAAALDSAVAERDEARARLAQAESRAADSTAEAERLRARLAETEEVVRTLRDEAAERASLAARLDAALGEQNRLEEVVATARAERDGLVAVALALAAAHAAMRDALAREAAERTRLEIRDATPPAPEQPAIPRAPEPEPANDGAPASASILVLDVDAAWAEAAPSGHGVRVLAPGAGLVERLRDLVPDRVVVNLAAPGVLGALAALRAAGSPVSFWGAIAAPRAGRALALGIVEPSPRPIDPDAVAAAVGRYGGRGTRIVTVGPDAEALISLRQVLTRQGMSVSRAWDTKQAADLLAMVRPDVVLVDLELSRPGCALVADLAALDPLPAVVLVPGGEDPAEAFAATLADPHRAERALPLERVLANVLRRQWPGTPAGPGLKRKI